jgi:hypothetical protein
MQMPVPAKSWMQQMRIFFVKEEKEVLYAYIHSLAGSFFPLLAFSACSVCALSAGLDSSSAFSAYRIDG